MTAIRSLYVDVVGHFLVVASRHEASTVDPFVLLRGLMTGDIPEPVQPQSLEVYTGIYSGPVEVTVAVCSIEPEDLASGWGDIEEYSLRVEEGEITVAAFESLPNVVGVHSGGPADYRVRGGCQMVCVSGGVFD